LRIRDGEPGAEDELVERYRQPVYAVAAARTRDPEAARDLTQEILLGVLRALREGRLEDADQTTPYIYGVARNRINTHLANLYRDRAAPLPPAAPPESTPEDLYEESERWDLVRRALERLKPQDRKILLLTLVDGLKPAEIAARMGISSERLRKRKSRALQKVRSMILETSRK
jgi:RNA polymerase sigma-70 factor (ECF subfamily)